MYEAIPENIIFKSQNRKQNQDVKDSMLVGREFMEAVPLKKKFNHGQIFLSFLVRLKGARLERQ